MTEQAINVRSWSASGFADDVMYSVPNVFYILPGLIAGPWLFREGPRTSAHGRKYTQHATFVLRLGNGNDYSLNTACLLSCQKRGPLVPREAMT